MNFSAERSVSSKKVHRQECLCYLVGAEGDVMGSIAEAGGLGDRSSFDIGCQRKNTD